MIIQNLINNSPASKEVDRTIEVRVRVHFYGHESTGWKIVLAMMRTVTLQMGRRVEFSVGGDSLEDDGSDRQPPEDEEVVTHPLDEEAVAQSGLWMGAGIEISYDDTNTARRKLTDDLNEVKKALSTRMAAVDRDLAELQSTYQRVSPYNCPVCGGANLFQERIVLDNDMEGVHTIAGPWHCRDCESSAQTHRNIPVFEPRQ